MKYGIIIFVFAFSLMMLVGEVTGVFGAPNGWLYDRLVVLNSGKAEGKSSVLLIDTGPSPQLIDSTTWQKLFVALNKHDPALIAFTFIPSLAQEKTGSGSRYLIGVAPEVLSGDVQIDSPVSLDRDDTIALLPQPKSQDGIYRFAQLTVEKELTFSSTVAQIVNNQTPLPDSSRIRINFNNGANWLPVVSFQRALEGGLIRELVNNRVILLGQVALLNAPGLMTPIHRDSGALSLSEFEGYTIESLLRGNEITELPWPLVLLLLLAVSALSLIIYQKINTVAVGRITVVVILIYALATWASLHWLMIWLPLFSLALTQLVLFIIAIRLRQLASEEALHQVLTDAGSWVRGYLMPDGFYESEQHWVQVMNLVDQSLDLQRFIFLERVEGDHRVREVGNLRCSLDDINELRRDYKRTPYSSAIENAGPLRLTSPYLTPLSEPEQQYLVPLSYAGSIVGFWAFSVAPDNISNKKFESIVNTFAVQIAEILYHRSIWRAEQALSTKFLTRYLSFRAGDDLNQRVIRTLNSLERRWDMVEQVLKELDTSTVLYDTFGRVLSANHSMEEFSRRYDLRMYDMSALDLLISLTQLSYDNGRESLNAVLFQKKELRFPVSLKDDSDKDTMLLLGVRAIGRSAEHKLKVDEATPFDIRGLLFEIVDASQFGEGYGIKHQFMERLIFQLRNDMEAVTTGVQVVVRDKVKAESRRRVADILLGKVEQTNKLLQEAEAFIGEALHEVSRKSYPVDTLALLKNIILERKPEFEQNKIEVITNFPSLLHMGFAETDRLTVLIEYMISLQLKDIGSDSQMRINVTSESGSQCIHISGNGFGLPNEEFQRYIYTDDTSVSEEFRRLREGVKELSDWGGELKVSSALGKGLTFEIKLRSVI